MVVQTSDSPSLKAPAVASGLIGGALATVC